ncbi:gp641 [Bacillus phage G]|uniref:Gp641 n=1 Tax=Bacillus phage G TaxID=2884420 RepID=G3MB21_9CAUD|nr:gp641 [Bacillus phage G]AEO93884.1 gp641 [Bacillus phage G]
MKNFVKFAILAVMMAVVINQLFVSAESNTEEEYKHAYSSNAQIKQDRLDEILEDGIIDHTEEAEYKELTKDF